jgi:uncharacterized protein YegP (UPF0339 family)
MATATKQVRPARGRARGTGDGAPSEFRVFQDNGGDYRWEVISVGGATLALSDSFASVAAAEHAVTQMREGAASAQFKPSGATAARADRRRSGARATAGR